MGESKPSIVELYRNLAGLMMGERPSALEKLTGPFPIQYLVTSNSVLLESDNHKVVKITTRNEIAATVMKFLDARAPEGFQWTAKQIKDFVDYWILLCPHINLPKTWAWPEEDCYAFHRIPFTPKPGPMPLWEELVGRIDNAEAFVLWIGSLFFDLADRQTYCWLYGEGQNGKGAILRALQKTFGSAYKADQVPERSDKFWTYWLTGKRLVAFGDTNNAAFPASGLFKSLTGGDAVRMEIKGGASFCAQLSALFIFASNERPNLSSEKADLRRAILCELSPIKGDPMPDYELNLWAEMPAFIHECLAQYQAHGFGPISADTAALEGWVNTNEDKYQAILDSEIKFESELKNYAPKSEADRIYIRATDMTLMLHDTFRNPNDIREFYRFLERKHKIKRKTVRIDDGKYEGRYVGLVLKDVLSRLLAKKKLGDNVTVKS